MKEIHAVDIDKSMRIKVRSRPVKILVLMCRHTRLERGFRVFRVFRVLAHGPTCGLWCVQPYLKGKFRLQVQTTVERV